MITALEKSEGHQSYREDLIRASDKLSKVLTEADVRLLMETMSQKNAAEVYVSQVFFFQLVIGHGLNQYL